jgi:hypothetical protein
VTSATYARDDQEQTAAGGVIIVAISILSALLVIAGLAYAAGNGARHQRALAAANCEPNLSPSGLPCTTVQMLVNRYATITAPVAQELSTDAAAYGANQRRRLGAAEAALTAEVTIEDALGKSLARFPFPPASAAVARTLIQDNQARAELTAQQARSSSLTQLRSFDHRVRAAAVAVRNEMKLVSQALAVRPAASQEP